MKRNILYVSVAVLLSIAYVFAIILVSGKGNLGMYKTGYDKMNKVLQICLFGPDDKDSLRKLVKDLEGSSDPVIIRGLSQIREKLANQGIKPGASNALQSADAPLSVDQDTELMVLISQIEKKENREAYIDFDLDTIDLKVNYFYYLEVAGFLDSDRIVRTPEIYGNLKKFGIYCHSMDLLDLALLSFEKLMTTYSEDFSDPEVAAWYGSVWTRKALYVTSSLEKIGFVKKGVKYLDDTVYNFPDNIVVRFIRINTYLSIPPFFQKDGLAVKDVGYVLDKLSRGEKSDIVRDFGVTEKIDVPVDQVTSIMARLSGATIGTDKKPLLEKWRQIRETRGIDD